jgi:hypothetical protein
MLRRELGLTGVGSGVGLNTVSPVQTGVGSGVGLNLGVEVSPGGLATTPMSAY